MTTSLLKLEDQSVQHYLREAILPLRWIEKVENVPLVYSSVRQRFEADIVWLPNFLDEGRGWVYFDNIDPQACVINSHPTTQQISRIVVRNQSNSVISSANYLISYTDGAIIASGGTTTPQGIPTTVDFYQYYVSLIDGWPGTEPPDPPIVAVEISGFSKEGFQLGGGRKSVRSGKLHIFATSSSERKDLTEHLYNAFYNRHIPIIDYRSGEPLNYNGTYNNNYTGPILRTDLNDDGLLYFSNVRADMITGRPDWSDLNRWRSRISFTMESYQDGQEFNAL